MAKVHWRRTDDVAIMITTIDKWTGKDIVQLMEDSACLGKGITAPAAITHFLGETFWRSCITTQTGG